MSAGQGLDPAPRSIKFNSTAALALKAEAEGNGMRLNASQDGDKLKLRTEHVLLLGFCLRLK